MDCYLCSVCKNHVLINTKLCVVTIVINGVTSNVIFWIVLITTFQNQKWKLVLVFFWFSKVFKKSIPQGNLNESAGALVSLIKQLNNFTDDEKENESNLPDCKYRDTDYFKNLTNDFKRKLLSFFPYECLLTY